MSIFRSNSILVNKNLTLNDTISCSCDNFYCFNSSMNSLVFFTVFLHCRKGDNNLRYFARLFIPPFTESLCISTVYWQLHEIYPGSILLDTISFTLVQEILT